MAFRVASVSQDFVQNLVEMTLCQRHQGDRLHQGSHDGSNAPHLGRIAAVRDLMTVTTHRTCVSWPARRSTNFGQPRWPQAQRAQRRSAMALLASSGSAWQSLADGVSSTTGHRPGAGGIDCTSRLGGRVTSSAPPMRWKQRSPPSRSPLGCGAYYRISSGWHLESGQKGGLGSELAVTVASATTCPGAVVRS